MALHEFDQLPAMASVRLPVVANLFSISRATVWRWCASGQLPAPIRIGGVTSWNVGELRHRLRNPSCDSVQVNSSQPKREPE